MGLPGKPWRKVMALRALVPGKWDGLLPGPDGERPLPVCEEGRPWQQGTKTLCPLG